jgi:hypothetical protein
VLMRVFQSINRSFVYKAKEGHHVRILFLSYHIPLQFYLGRPSPHIYH